MENNERYTSLAAVYERFMKDIPYVKWARFITSQLHEYAIDNGLVADLCCGTGTMTRLLSDSGYDMIGIDSSEEMLSVARSYAADRAGLSEETDGILYLEQDIREMELYGTVAAMTCICDGINYLLEQEELRRVFALVNNYLDPGGLFIFDMKTPFFYNEILGNNTFADNDEEGSVIWENEQEESGLHYYDLTIYRRSSVQDEEGRGEGSEIYRRYEETHVQRGYDMKDVIRLIEGAGMHFVKAFGFDGEKFTEPYEKNDRIFYVARESGKKK